MYVHIHGETFGKRIFRLNEFSLLFPTISDGLTGLFRNGPTGPLVLEYNTKNISLVVL